MPGNVYRIRLFRVIGSGLLMLAGVFVGNKGYFKSIDFPYFPLGLKNLKSAGVKSVPVRVRSAAPRRRSLRTAQKTRFRKSRVFFGCAPGLLLLPTRPAPLGSRGVPDWKPAAFRFRGFRKSRENSIFAASLLLLPTRPAPPGSRGVPFFLR